MLLVVQVGIEHREEAGPQTFDLAGLYLIRTHKSLQGTFFFFLDKFNWTSVTSITGLSWH